MGYPLNLFASTIDDNLLCSICSGVLQKAVLTPCGHSFCSECLQTWINRSRLSESENNNNSYIPGSQVHGFQTSASNTSGSFVPGSRTPGSHTTASVPGSDAFFWESVGPDDRDAVQPSQDLGSTCPECRTWISPDLIHPILSLRSLVLSMMVYCDYTNEGCTMKIPLEKYTEHVQSCKFAIVECAGCGFKTPREKLADHQLSCQFILSLYTDNNRRQSDQDPANRINYLSHQIRMLQSDLAETRLRNGLLSNQLQQAKKELEYKQRHLQQIQNVFFDPDYNYGFVNSSIGKLSSLISRFLREKPSYIDSKCIFQCVKRCYDNFGRCGTAYEDDVWMLLATASASTWFSEQQKQAIRVWQMSLARYKQCTQWTMSKQR